MAQTPGNDGFVGTNVNAADTPTTFRLAGGKYSVCALAASWGGGNVNLQILGPDGATYVSVLTSAITANSFVTGDLPGGTYKFVITTTNAVYMNVSKIR